MHGSYASRHRDQVHALDMLADDIGGIRGVVSDVVDLDDAPEAFARIRAGEVLKVVVRPEAVSATPRRRAEPLGRQGAARADRRAGARARRPAAERARAGPQPRRLAHRRLREGDRAARGGRRPPSSARVGHLRLPPARRAKRPQPQLLRLVDDRRDGRSSRAASTRAARLRPRRRDVAAALGVERGDAGLRPSARPHRGRPAGGRHRPTGAGPTCSRSRRWPALEGGSIYAALAERGLPVHHGVATITPAVAEGEVARAAGASPPGHAAADPLPARQHRRRATVVLVSQEHHLADAFEITVYRRGPGDDAEAAGERASWSSASTSARREPAPRRSLRTASTSRRLRAAHPLLSAARAGPSRTRASGWAPSRRRWREVRASRGRARSARRVVRLAARRPGRRRRRRGAARPRADLDGPPGRGAVRGGRASGSTRPGCAS